MKSKIISGTSIFIIFSFIFSTLLYSQTILDYQSQISTHESMALRPVGYGNSNLGPYIVHNKIWVFYSDGENAIWRTKQAEQGGQWSHKGIVFKEREGIYFDVVFDGVYFHFVREDQGDVKYRRGKPNSDGTILFDSEKIAWVQSDGWFASDFPGYQNIGVSSDGKPWIIFQAKKNIGGNWFYKPIAISSTNNEGGWTGRTGFPFDLDTAYDDYRHGTGMIVHEISPGKMIFLWQSRYPNQGHVARIWQNGTMGGGENTNLVGDNSELSIVNLDSERILVNNQMYVVRRESDGTWTNSINTGAQRKLYNSLTISDGNVRIWWPENNAIRYRESSDGGNTWSRAITKWNTIAPIYMVASHARGSQSDHHAVLWRAGDTHRYISHSIPGSQATIVTNESHAFSVGDTIRISQHIGSIPDINGDYTIVGVPSATSFTINTELTSGGSAGRANSYSEVVMGIDGVIESPGTPLLVNPQNEELLLKSEVVFRWSKIPHAGNYRFRVSTTNDFSSSLEDTIVYDTTYHVIDLEDDQTYFWQVRAENIDGQSDWSETWEFATIIDSPEVPLLTSPVDGAEDISIDTVLSWESADRAETYRVQLSTDSEFDDLILDESDVADTTINVSGLEHSTDHYWRVRASNVGGESDWSVVWSFTTGITPPEVPALVSPADRSVHVAVDTTLVWDAAERAVSYRIQLATDEAFYDLVVSATNVTETSLDIGDLAHDTDYYWRVRAENLGGLSNWSGVWEFRTIVESPEDVVLFSPSNGAENISTDTLLVWIASDRAESYNIQVSTDSDFSEVFTDTSGVTKNQLSVAGLDNDTQYFWRVRAMNVDGYSNWSPVWRFTTQYVTSVHRLVDEIPEKFHIEQNYPNPFNPTTTIRFGLPEAASVRLEVYNMLGQRVVTLIDGEHYTAGTYEAVWDARDDTGTDVSSGMYIYRISTGDYVNVKKMLYLR